MLYQTRDAPDACSVAQEEAGARAVLQHRAAEALEGVDDGLDLQRAQSAQLQRVVEVVRVGRQGRFHAGRQRRGEARAQECGQKSGNVI